MDNISSPPTFSKQISTPLLISLIGIASTTLAIVIYHLVVTKYCASRRRHRHHHTPPYSSSSENSPSRGLDSKLLETVPVMSYSALKPDTFRIDQSECVICLGELEEDESVRVLPSCKHAFHVPCVDRWFTGHANCPICRSPIVAPMVPKTSPEIISGLVQETTRQNTIPHKPLASQHRDHYDRDVTGGGGEGRSLRHFRSIDLPAEGGLGMKLKRSYSLDQSYLVVIEMGRSENEMLSSSLPSTSTSSGSCSNSSKVDRSVRGLDRVSSKLLRSFSRLRIGRGGTGNGMLLPY